MIKINLVIGKNKSWNFDNYIVLKYQNFKWVLELSFYCIPWNCIIHIFASLLGLMVVLMMLFSPDYEHKILTLRSRIKKGRESIYEDCEEWF